MFYPVKMKVNFLKKLVAVTLCAVIFLGTSVNSYASEIETQVAPRYTYIDSLAMSLSINNGNAHIVADLISKDSSKDCYIKCNLEKLTGSYWMQIKSFEKTNRASATLIADHSIDRGTYRVMGTFRLVNETQTAYTGNKTY